MVTISGAVRLTVSDAGAFAADPVVAQVLAESFAQQSNCPVEWVTVQIFVAQRRLRASRHLAEGMVDIHYEINLVAEEDSEDALQAMEERASEIISGLDGIDEDTNFESAVNRKLSKSNVSYQVADVQTILAPETTLHSIPSNATSKSFFLAIFISLLSTTWWL